MGLILFFVTVAVGVSFLKSREAIQRISELESKIRQLKDELRNIQLRQNSQLQADQKNSEPVPPPQSQTPSELRIPAVDSLPGNGLEEPPNWEETPVAAGPYRMPLETVPQRKPPANISPIEETHTPASCVDWEKFTGVRLFAWLGGFALFLGAAFFVKYSIEHDLISPMLRIVMGFVLGTGVIGGGLWLRPRGYSYTVDALAAAGIAILYANIFAATNHYHFIGTNAAFVLMAMVTTTAFLLSLRLDSKYVAILGMLGGFLTPPMLSTGVDRPLELFGYIAMLDIGLAATALRRRWGFLVALSAVATLRMEIGWVSTFFVVDKAPIAVAIFIFFSILFLAALRLAERMGSEDPWVRGAAIGMPMVSMSFTVYLISFSALAARPGLVLSYLFVPDACMVYLAWQRADFRRLISVSGGIAFAVLLLWTSRRLTAELLPWGLTYYLVFGAFHSLLPFAFRKKYPDEPPSLFGNLYPVLMLLLTLIPMVNVSPVPFILWPFFLALVLLALLVVLLTSIVWIGIVVVGLTFWATWICLDKISEPYQLAGLLWVVAGFAFVFFAAGLYLHRRFSRRESGSATKPEAADKFASYQQGEMRSFNTINIFSSASGLLPFMLLSAAADRLVLQNPSEIFRLGVLLTALLYAVVRYQASDGAAIAALVGTLLLQYGWHLKHVDPAQPLLPMGWYAGFLLLHLAFPFVFRRWLDTRWIPWAVSAMAGPAYFYLLYKPFLSMFGETCIGILPAALGFIYLTCLYRLAVVFPPSSPARNTGLAFFGGVTLFFVSLIFPLQFNKEWITIGWAVEGMALMWLLRRIPHEGLKIWGAALLVIAFVRLAVNPALFEYHARADLPVWNWYLYAYGTVAACLLAAARLLASPPRNNLVMGYSAPPIFCLLAAILGFLLLNIEIADYFSAGVALTFQFSGNLARDVSYSIGWSLYGFGILLIGFQTNNRGARYGSLLLLCATILKVFFHDLWQLGQLYRVASFIGLAVILILASFLYQRFMSKQSSEKKLR